MKRATAYSNSCSQVVLVYFHSFRCNSLLKWVLQPKIAKKNHKTLYFGGSRSFKVINVKPLKANLSAVIVTVRTSLYIYLQGLDEPTAKK